MPAVWKKRAKKAHVKKPLIGRSPVTDKEKAKASSLAKRKAGVTRRQLAKALRITEARAAIVLTRVPKLKSAPLGAEEALLRLGTGKACRTLVFRLK
jgi:hypothetical protein